MPCYGKQGGKIPQVAGLQKQEKPLFLGAETGSTDGLSPELSPECNKIELILSLIDSLTPEEKERLFDKLDSVKR